MSLVWHSSFCKESISQLLYWFWKVLSWQLELKMNFIRCYREEQGPSSPRDTPLHTEEVPLSLPFTSSFLHSTLTPDEEFKGAHLYCLLFVEVCLSTESMCCVLLPALSVLLRKPLSSPAIWRSLCWADLDR